MRVSNGNLMLVERDITPLACADCGNPDCPDPIEPLKRSVRTLRIYLDVSGELKAGEFCPVFDDVTFTFAGKPFAVTRAERMMGHAILFRCMPADWLEQILPEART